MLSKVITTCSQNNPKMQMRNQPPLLSFVGCCHGNTPLFTSSRPLTCRSIDSQGVQICNRNSVFDDKGRTIRKVMGGGGGRGIFSSHDFFFSPSACAGIFFAGETLYTNFFFF